MTFHTGQTLPIVRRAVKEFSKKMRLLISEGSTPISIILPQIYMSRAVVLEKENGRYHKQCRYRLHGPDPGQFLFWPVPQFHKSVAWLRKPFINHFQSANSSSVGWWSMRTIRGLAGRSFCTSPILLMPVHPGWWHRWIIFSGHDNE